MKAGMLFTESGPLVILTEHDSLTHPKVLDSLHAKGVDKFIGHELPVEDVRARYGHHFEAVIGDLRQSDELRILDVNGHRAFQLFNLRDLGAPIVHESATIERMSMS